MNLTGYSLGLGALAIVVVSSLSFGTSPLIEEPLMELMIITEEVSAGEVPDLGDKKIWQCEDVTAEDDDARCGIVHICQSRRNAMIMARQISLQWNRMPVYRIWGPAGKTHQSLRMLESKVWMPPLPGGKMECGFAIDEQQRIGIVFLIYEEGYPDLWAAQSFFPIEYPPAPAISARPLRRTSY